MTATSDVQPLANAVPNGRRMIVDIRRTTIGEADLSCEFLGLPLFRRLLLAARRCGFGSIAVLTDTETGHSAISQAPDIDDLTVYDALTAVAEANIETIILPGHLLGETKWLNEVASEPVDPGILKSAEPGILLLGNKVLPAMAFDNKATAASFTVDPAPMIVSRESDVAEAKRRLLKSLVKDTDGVMSRYIARPISISISRLVAPTRLSPNQMTFISLLIGLAAAPFFLSTVAWMQAIGGLLFVIHSVVDGCDGELARLRYQESRFGGLLDFWSDNLVHIAVFSCMAIGWAYAENAGWPLLVGLAAVLGAGGSALAVYWLTLRQKKASGPLYTSVSSGPSTRLIKILDELSRRDFIYLIFALSLFGKAAWFLALTAIGAPIFLGLLLLAVFRDETKHRTD